MIDDRVDGQYVNFLAHPHAITAIAIEVKDVLLHKMTNIHRLNKEN